MAADLTSLRADFPVWITWPVQWGDQDAFGHVNNTVYLRWFESSRIEYSQRVGLAQVDASQRVAPILAAVSCNYRRQIRFPDTVHVGARIVRLGRSSMTMQHRVLSSANAELAAEGDCVVVTYDYLTKRPIPIPPELREAISRIEQRSIAELSAPPGHSAAGDHSPVG